MTYRAISTQKSDDGDEIPVVGPNVQKSKVSVHNKITERDSKTDVLKIKPKTSQIIPAVSLVNLPTTTFQQLMEKGADQAQSESGPRTISDLLEKVKKAREEQRQRDSIEKDPRMPSFQIPSVNIPEFKVEVPPNQKLPTLPPLRSTIVADLIMESAADQEDEVIAGLQVELRQVKAELQEKQATISRVMQQVTAAEVSRDRAIAEFQAQRDCVPLYRKEIDQAVGEAEAAKKDLAGLREIHNKRMAELVTANGELGITKFEVVHLKETASKLEGQLRAAKDKLSEELKITKITKFEVVHLKETASKLEGQLKEAQHELVRQKEISRDLTEADTTKTVKIVVLQAALSAEKSRSNSQLPSMSVVRDEVIAVQKEVDRLKKDNGELFQQLTTAKAQLTAYVASTQEKKTDQSKTEQNAFQKTMALTQQICDLTNEKKARGDVETGLRRQIDQMKEQNQVLRERNETLEALTVGSLAKPTTSADFKFPKSPLQQSTLQPVMDLRNVPITDSKIEPVHQEQSALKQVQSEEVEVLEVVQKDEDLALQITVLKDQLEAETQETSIVRTALSGLEVKYLQLEKKCKAYEAASQSALESESDQLKVEKQKMEGMARMLKDRISQNSKLQERIADLESQLAYHQKNSLRSQVVQNQDDTVTIPIILFSQLTDSESQIIDLTEQLSQAEASLAEVKSKKEEASLAENVDEIDSLEDRLVDGKLHSDLLIKKIKSLEEKIENLVRDLEDTGAHVNQLIRERDSLKKEIVIRDERNHTKTMQKEIDRLNQEVFCLRSMMEAAQNSAMSLTKITQRLETEKAELIKEVKLREIQRLQSIGEVTSLKIEFTNLQDDHRSKLEKVSQMESKVKALKAEKTELDGKIKKAADLLDSLKTGIKAMAIELAVTRMENSAQRDVINTLKDQMRKLEDAKEARSEVFTAWSQMGQTEPENKEEVDYEDMPGLEDDIENSQEPCYFCGKSHDGEHPNLETLLSKMKSLPE